MKSLADETPDIFRMGIQVLRFFRRITLKIHVEFLWCNFIEHIEKRIAGPAGVGKRGLLLSIYECWDQTTKENLLIL